MYILAGKRRLEEVRAGRLEELRVKAEQTGLAEDAQAYNDMLSGMLTNYDPRRTAAIDTSVPLLILSGDADPIGEYGKGVIRLRDDFLDLGCDDVRVILYPGARHELLNETNRDQVIRDILDWLNALLESTH